MRQHGLIKTEIKEIQWILNILIVYITLKEVAKRWGWLVGGGNWHKQSRDWLMSLKE